MAGKDIGMRIDNDDTWLSDEYALKYMHWGKNNYFGKKKST